MTNLKISELSEAADLSGSELFPIVQDGSNVTTQPSNIADFVLRKTSQIRIGNAVGSPTNSDNSIVIGSDSIATNSGAITLGQYSTSGLNAATMGYSTSANGPNSLALGMYSSVHSTSTSGIAIGANAYVAVSTVEGISIGENSYTSGDFTIAIGGNSRSYEKGGIAIGKHSKNHQGYGISIGYQSYNNSGQFSIALGSYTTIHGDRGIVIGHRASNFGGDDQVAIGRDAYSYGIGSISIGTSAKMGLYVSESLALGYNAYIGPYTSNAIAIGFVAKTMTTGGTAIGRSAYSTADYAVALGYDTEAHGYASVAIGYRSIVTSSSFFGVSIGSAVTNNSDHGVAIGHGVSLGISNNRIVALGDNINVNSEGANDSVVIGSNASVSGANSVVLGIDSNTTTDTNQVAIGSNAHGMGQYAIAVGTSAQAYQLAVSIGKHSQANSYNSIAIGRESYVYTGTSQNAIAIGRASHVYGNSQSSIAIGYFTFAQGYASTVVGSQSFANHYGVALGYNTNANVSSVAVGAYAGSATYGVALGYKTVVNQEAGIAIGLYATVHTPDGIAIGTDSYSSSLASISIGRESRSEVNYGIAIGYHARLGSYLSYIGNYGIAVGSHSNVTGPNGIAIGTNSYAGPYKNTIAIGKNAWSYSNHAISIGYNSKANGDYAVAIGYGARSYGKYSTTLGDYSYATNGGLAIGYATANNYSISIGYDATTNNANHAIAIGAEARINNGAYQAIAIGDRAIGSYPGTIVLGANAQPFVQSSHVVRLGQGNNGGGNLAPAIHTQAFFAATHPGQKAYAIYSTVDWGVFVNWNVVGTVPNGTYSVQFVDSTGTPDVALNATFSSPNLIITLATDGGGVVTTTQADLASYMDGLGYHTSWNNGGPSTVISVGVPGDTFVSFAGGVDPSGTIQLTSDGLAVASNNVPNIGNGGIARASGHVMAFEPGVLGDPSGERAVWIMNPIIVTRTGPGVYVFHGEPTFTLENGSDQPPGWPLPTFTTNGETLFLNVTADDTIDLNLSWMGFLKFETNY